MNTANEGCRSWSCFFSFPFFLFFLRNLRHSKCKRETNSFTDDVNSCKQNFFLEKKEKKSDGSSSGRLDTPTIRLSSASSVPLAQRPSLSARNSPLLFLLLSLIRRKAASSQLSAQETQLAEVSLQLKCFPLRNTSRRRGVVIRRSLWRFSIPSVSCEAAWNWPRSWPASAGPGRASSAQSHSWQWSSWRRKHWRCPGYGALWSMKKKDQKKKNGRKRHLLCTWCSFSSLNLDALRQHDALATQKNQNKPELKSKPESTD